jgi:predicted nucleic acid-binding protein
MRFLLDTNILLRLIDRRAQQHSGAVDAVKRLESAGHELHVVPQVLYEFWVVATRPADQNGFGMSTKAAYNDLVLLQQLFSLLRDERAIFERWQDLVSQHDVKGKGAHDARLVAAMQRHGITHLLTFNDKDFERFTGINRPNAWWRIGRCVALKARIHARRIQAEG